MGRTIGIAKLKDKLSAIVGEVIQGATITVTNRKKPVALIIPYDAQAMDEMAASLVAAGLIRWRGDKPVGITDRPDTTAAPLAEAIAEDRR